MLAWYLVGFAGVAFIVAILVTAYQASTQRSRTFLNSLSDLSPTPPSRLTLGPNWLALWDHPSVAKISGDLEALGFRRIGVFAVEEMAGLEVYPMHSNELSAFVSIFKISGSDWAWYEIFSPLEGGGWIVVTSSPRIGPTATKPGWIKVNLQELPAKLAVKVFTRDLLRYRRAVQATTQADYEALFARCYAEERGSAMPEGLMRI